MPLRPRSSLRHGQSEVSRRRRGPLPRCCMERQAEFRHFVKGALGQRRWRSRLLAARIRSRPDSPHRAPPARLRPGRTCENIFPDPTFGPIPGSATTARFRRRLACRADGHEWLPRPHGSGSHARFPPPAPLSGPFSKQSLTRKPNLQGCKRNAFQAGGGPKTSTALRPPKAKEFDMA